MAITNPRIRRKMQAAEQADRRHEATAKKAVGYVRVSTDEQAETGFSLGAQREAIAAFATSQGYELIEMVEDAGVSGATDPATRPGFRQVVERAAAHEFSILLVWRFDRLARHLAFAVTITDRLLREYAVAVRSVTEPLDTTTGLGQVIFSVLAGMAQMEKAAITERTMMGKKAKALRGGYTGGKVPYGYERDKEGGLRPNPGEAAVVRQIYGWAREGSGAKAIARRLNRAGVPTRGGNPWAWQTVQGILFNPRYAGRAEYFFADEAKPIEAPAAHDPLLPKVRLRPRRGRVGGPQPEPSRQF